MKKTIALILSLIILPSFIQGNDIMKEEEIMVAVLEDLGGAYVQGDISANEKIYEDFYTSDILEAIGDDIKEDLGMIEEDRLVQDEKNYSQINYYGYDKDDNKLILILSSYYNEEGGTGDTYLYINYLNDEQFLNINGIIDDVKNIYKNYGVEGSITTNIIGKIENENDLEKYQYKLEKSIDKMDGKILGTYEDDNLIAYNIYSDWLEEHIIIGNDKMNLNIGLRCNKIDDSVVIYIGTPIIVGGY